jgi:hypothetical protein
MKCASFFQANALEHKRATNKAQSIRFCMMITVVLPVKNNFENPNELNKRNVWKARLKMIF